jgi:hypothetical protein
MVTSGVVGLATPTGAGTVGCTDASRACVISAANSYLNALVSHDGNEARLAPSAIRTENGIDTGDGGPEIASELTNSAQYKVIEDIRDVRWFVDGDEAIALYLIDIAIPVVETHIATVHVAERFEVVNGLITQIEAFYCAHPGVTPETERSTSSEPLVSEQCFGP